MVIILTFAFFGLLALANFLVFKTRECNQKERLFERIKWFVESQSNTYQFKENKRASELIKIICRLQRGIRLDSKYQIKEREFRFVENIIAQYQYHLIQLYFGGCDFESYKDLNQIQFFIVTLNDFFCYYDPKNLMYKNHKKHLINISAENEEIESLDSPLFHELSNFGLAYYKLLYITQLECIEIGKITGIYSNNYMSINTTKMSIEERKVKY